MSIKDKATCSLDADIQEAYSSKFNFRNFKLNWIIEDFEFVANNMKVFESPRFPSTEKVQWYLRLEPTELKEDNEEDFQVFLKNTDNSERYLSAKISFLSSASKKTLYLNQSMEKFDTNTYWEGRTGAQFYRTLIKNEVEDDEMFSKEVTVICEICLFDNGFNIVKKPLAASLKSEDLINQLGCFFDDQVFKDVKFIVEEKEFNAHKVILAFRSPVFAAMFKSKMSEELTSIVEIKDIKSTIFHLMLRFIYTDEEVENLEESALELFYAAEKYQLEKLKNMCLNSLYDNVSAETAVKVLELADVFSITKLKDKVQECLVSNLKAVTESEEYLKLIERRPHLACEILKLQNIMYHESFAHSDHSKEMAFLNFEFK